MNENERPPVKLIVGTAWQFIDDPAERVHIMLVAPDDDTAVARATKAFQTDGYARLDLDQIGEMSEEPDDEPFTSAFQTAMEGEVAIIRLGKVEE